MSTAEHITTALDANHESWRDHLQAVRHITAVLEFTDTNSNETRRVWQTTLITVFQRVAYADADSGGVSDISDWCLKQAVTLLPLYPENVDLLTRKYTRSFVMMQYLEKIVIGRNWLSRAQRSLAKIHLSEQNSSCSGGSPSMPLSTSEENRRTRRSDNEAESRLYTSDYVEARGILLPAVEYLERAAEAAHTQGKMTGDLLSVVSNAYCTNVVTLVTRHYQAAEAFMSLGNVSSLKTNGRYFQKALSYLRTATELSDYILPQHLQK